MVELFPTQSYVAPFVFDLHYFVHSDPDSSRGSDGIDEDFDSSEPRRDFEVSTKALSQYKDNSLSHVSAYLNPSSFIIGYSSAPPRFPSDFIRY